MRYPGSEAGVSQPGRPRCGVGWARQPGWGAVGGCRLAGRGEGTLIIEEVQLLAGRPVSEPLLAQRLLHVAVGTPQRCAGRAGTLRAVPAIALHVSSQRLPRQDYE